MTNTGSIPPRKSPVLVTGAHRSGTTWIGRMLAQAPGVFYIHEPFSVTHPPDPGICSLRVQHWFAYAHPGNESAFVAPLRRSLALRYDWRAAVAAKQPLRQTLTESRRMSRSRRSGAVALLKDPLAFFSAEWLARRFDASVVVVIRHPAAFASSLKLLHWSHPFDHFLMQEQLIRDHLQPFAEELRWFAAAERPVLAQAILLWRIIYGTAARYRQTHPDWLFVRHEDLSRDPVGGFERLYERHGLDFTPAARRAVEAHSGAHNPAQPREHIGSEAALRRNSLANLENWKSRLSADEIEHIRRGVEPMSRHFYSDADW